MRIHASTADAWNNEAGFGEETKLFWCPLWDGHSFWHQLLALALALPLHLCLRCHAAADSGRGLTLSRLSKHAPSCSCRERQDLISCPPPLVFSGQVLTKWLCGVHLMAAWCVLLDIDRKSQTADSFDRWLWNGARLLWLSSVIFSSTLFAHPSEDNTARARSWGWLGKLSSTYTDISGN